jgi:peptidoglycan hydrolase-like protein with peptidoglycan-binding domain
MLVRRRSMQRAARAPVPQLPRSRASHVGAAFLQLQAIVGNHAMAGLIDRVQRTWGLKSGCSCLDGAAAKEPRIGRLFRPDSRALAQLVPYVMRQEAPVALLRRGSRGTGVSDLQNRLNKVGAVPHVEPDGTFGGQTELAVRFFQRAHRLVDDGIVGRETNAMLERETALHGTDAAIAERGGLPCHDPSAPGPEDIAGSRQPNQTSTDKGRLPQFTLNVVAADGGAAPAGSPLVAQQSGAQDLVVQLTDDDISNAEGAAVGGGSKPIKVGSLSALKSALQGKTIGKLSIISHSFTSGEIRFDAGTLVDTKSLEEIARELRGVATVQQIVFLGCNVGNDPDGLNKMKSALGATSSEGVNCALVTQKLGPILIDGAPVDSQQKFDALPPDKRAEVDKGLKALGDKARGNCVIELPPKKLFSSLTLDEIHRIAFSHNGVLVTRFTKEDGQCWNELQFGGKARCKRVQAK